MIGAVLLLATALVGVAALLLLARARGEVALFRPVDGFRSAIGWAGALWTIGLATCWAGLIVALLTILGERGTDITFAALALGGFIANLVIGRRRAPGAPRAVARRVEALAGLGLIVLLAYNLIKAVRT